MYLDEQHAWTVEANQGHGRVDYGAAHNGQHASASDLNRQSRLNLSTNLSKKTADEVWQDIRQERNKTIIGINSHARSSTLCDITLQEFLADAGVVSPGEKDSGPALGANQGHGRLDYDASASIYWQSSLNLSTGLSKKTVDEVWKDILSRQKKTTSGINTHARSSTLDKMTLEEFLVKAGLVIEGEKDSRPALGADPVVLPQQNVPRQAPDQQLTHGDVIQQQEHIGTVEKVNESGEESYVEFIGNAMNTGPFSCHTKQSLHQQEVTEMEGELSALYPSHQMSKDAMHVSGITLDTEKDETTVKFINKTGTKEKSKRENKKFERDINLESITEYFGKPLDDAAKSFNISRSTFKRICREHGVSRWPSSKRRMVENTFSKLSRVNEEDPSRKEDPTIVAHSGQKMNEVTVKAAYNGVSIRFELSDSSRMVELEDNVIERLQLERKKFSIKYQDDEGDWVLIACDKDVRKCMEISRSLRNTTIKMLIDLPIHHCAP